MKDGRNFIAEDTIGQEKEKDDGRIFIDPRSLVKHNEIYRFPGDHCFCSIVIDPEVGQPEPVVDVLKNKDYDEEESNKKAKPVS